MFQDVMIISTIWGVVGIPLTMVLPFQNLLVAPPPSVWTHSRFFFPTSSPLFLGVLVLALG